MPGDSPETVTPDLEGFLASLGGPVHSSGSFTISEQAAREKLARFTLVHPSLYLLELVAVAVLGGAKCFEVSTHGGATHFRFDGQPLGARDCEQARAHLFQSSSSPRLGCLGLGLSAALSLAQQPLTLLLEEEGFSFDDSGLHPVSEKGTRSWTEIRVPGPFGFLGGLFRKDASLRQTLQLCSMAPLILSLDGERLSDSWKPDRYWGAAGLLVWKNPLYPLPWDGGTVNPRLDLPSPGDFSALLTILPPESRIPGLTVIHQGVTYSSRDPELAVPGLAAVIMTNSLERNLSRSEIVWEARYREMARSLLEGADQLLRHILTTPYRMTERIRHCRPSVEWSARRRSEADPDKIHFQSWFEAEELSRAARTTPVTIAAAAAKARQAGPSRGAEDLSLLAIDMVIDKFRQPGYRRNLTSHLREWTPMLAEQLPFLQGTVRTKSLEEFLGFLQPLHLGPEPTLEHQILRYRILGQPERAAELMTGWDQRYAIYGFYPISEVYLALGDPASALNRWLETEDESDVEQALDREWPAYRRRELDFLADLLEYLDHPRAIEARRLALTLETDADHLLPAHLELSRQCRAKGRIKDWIHHRAKASFQAIWSKSEVATAACDLPAMWADLEKKSGIPTDLDGYLLPLCDKLGGSNPFLIMRLTHRLRLRGELIKADQLMARAYTLARMDSALFTL